MARFSAPPEGGRPTVDLASAVRLKMLQDAPRAVGGPQQRPIGQILCTLILRMVPLHGEVHLGLVNGAVLDAVVHNRLEPAAARAALCSPAECSLYVYRELIARNNPDGSDALQVVTTAATLLRGEM